MIQTSDFQQSIGSLLAEAFGVSSRAAFLDTGTSGLLGCIDSIDARTASAELRPGDETIAAHCAHLLYDLNLFLAYEKGQAPQADYPASWKVRGLNETAWKNLRLELRGAYAEVQERLQSRQAWPKIVIDAWLAELAHVAYHVGVIAKLRSALEDGG